MSRSGYIDDCDYDPDMILSQGRWRGQVLSAMRGARGQALLRKALEALDAIPSKQLGEDSLALPTGHYCTIGAVYAHQALEIPAPDEPLYDEWGTDPNVAEEIIDSASVDLDAAHQLIREIMWENDHCVWSKPGEVPGRTRQRRWQRMRKWIEHRIKAEAGGAG